MHFIKKWNEDFNTLLHIYPSKVELTILKSVMVDGFIWDKTTSSMAAEEYRYLFLY